MKSFALLLVVAIFVVVGCHGQNLLTLLQSPPVTLESPSPLPPDFRAMVKMNATILIMSGLNPSVALQLDHAHTPYSLYAGYRFIEGQDPVDNNTIFRIASMSKLITAVSVLQYAEKNLLKLDDPVSKYIPDFGKARVIEKVAPTAHYTFTSVETYLGSRFATIPLPQLSIPQLNKLKNGHVGIRLLEPLDGAVLDGVLKVKLFNPIAKTITVEMKYASDVFGVTSVNGSLDVLPKLRVKQSPYDYVMVPSDPLNPTQVSRVYYTTEPSKTIKIRHLLTHTVGYAYATPGYTSDLTSVQTAIMMKSDPILCRWVLTPTTDMDAVEWARKLAKIPMMFQPGEEWSYGPQMAIAGAVLMAIKRKQPHNADATLYDIQKEDLFDPLGITDAGYFIHNDDPRRNEKISNLAHIYTALDSQLTGTPTCTTPFGSMVAHLQDTMIPGFQIALMDGSSPATEGDDNPDHPIYGLISHKKFEAGDAGLFMRQDEFHRIIQMLMQNGTYNGQQILQPSTVAAMFSNQIGEVSVVPTLGIEGNAKWGYGTVVGQQSANPHPLVQTTAHWAGAFGGWWFINHKSTSTAFSMNSNSLPGVFREVVASIVNSTI